jgi:HSP20 family protein
MCVNDRTPFRKVYRTKLKIMSEGDGLMVEKSHTAGWWPQLYEPLKGFGEKIADWFAPRSDASAAVDAYEICLELPGVKSDDIDVSMEADSLTVRGEKRFEREEKGRTYFFSEREYGAFQRSFRLPADAEGENAEANFQDGVLIIRVPKKGQTEVSSRRIEVKTG